jgi:tetratricopeptide (TPR) repeat protein
MPTPNSQRLACWFLALIFAPATALADPNDEAKRHVASAAQAHKDGHYEAARIELEAAYALAPTPELLYALGQVHAKLGRCREATSYFQRFAAARNDPQVGRIVDQAIAACKPAVLPRSPDTAASGNTPAQGTAAPAPAARTEHPAWYDDSLGDGLVLGGVAIAAVGLVEYRGARSDLDAAEDRASTTTLARYHELVDDAHGKRTMSIVLVGTGGLVIAAGIARYVLSDRATEARGVGVAPAQGGGVISYAGRF